MSQDAVALRANICREFSSFKILGQEKKLKLNFRIEFIQNVNCISNLNVLKISHSFYIIRIRNFCQRWFSMAKSKSNKPDYRPNNNGNGGKSNSKSESNEGGGEENEEEQFKSKEKSQESECKEAKPESPIKKKMSKTFNKKRRKTKPRESTRKVRLSRANLKGLERMLNRITDSELAEYSKMSDNAKVINLLTIAFKQNVLSGAEVEQIKNQRKLFFEYSNKEEQMEKTNNPLIQKLLEQDRTKLTLIDVNEVLSKLLQEEEKSKKKYKKSREINLSLSIIDKLLNNIEVISKEMKTKQTPEKVQTEQQQIKLEESKEEEEEDDDDDLNDDDDDDEEEEEKEEDEY